MEGVGGWAVVGVGGWAVAVLVGWGAVEVRGWVQGRGAGREVEGRAVVWAVWGTVA